MPTLADAAESLEVAERLLQEILNEETVDFFTGPPELAERAGMRMLAIGELLYDRPRDCLHISLWEALDALHPETRGEDDRFRALFLPVMWRLATAVGEATKWEEFRAAVVNLHTDEAKLHLV